MRKISLPPSRVHITANRKNPESETENANVMLDARYLRQSSSLIQDALQKGFDVLQLANGDIVTTGTKTVVYQYSWDNDKGKLTKLKSAKRRSEEEEDELVISE
jgi:hypothetical protein